MSTYVYSTGIDFASLLLAAKSQDKAALEQLIRLYKPLINNTSMIGERIDEDLQQSLVATAIKCVYLFHLK